VNNYDPQSCINIIMFMISLLILGSLCWKICSLTSKVNFRPHCPRWTRQDTSWHRVVLHRL